MYHFCILVWKCICIVANKIDCHIQWNDSIMNMLGSNPIWNSDVWYFTLCRSNIASLKERALWPPCVLKCKKGSGSHNTFGKKMICSVNFTMNAWFAVAAQQNGEIIVRQLARYNKLGLATLSLPWLSQLFFLNRMYGWGVGIICANLHIKLLLWHL